MQKIPTLFRRDPDDMRHVLPEVNPACKWVFDGEGIATRKYDGTCVMYDGERWWARREVKPGKTTPVNFVPVGTDETTGKTVGWEPIEQSAFAKYHAQALGEDAYETGTPWPAGTYELIGPKINGNPERSDRHTLLLHAEATELPDAPRDFKDLREWMLAHPQFEGIVWHHPDGRMAKLKRRDFA
jgi:hypothetical protein